MPVTTSYPGIYIEELPSSTHTITAAPTSITVFVGYTHPFKTKSKTKSFNDAVQIFSFTDYEREFGGFFSDTAFDNENEVGHFGSVAHAVNQFFLNGGASAYVIGIQAHSFTSENSIVTDHGPITAQTVTIGNIIFTARELTETAHEMTVTINNIQGDTADITIIYGSGTETQIETFRKVSTKALDALNRPNPNFIETRIGTTDNPVSSLVTVELSTPFIAADHMPVPHASSGGNVTIGDVSFTARVPTDPAHEMTVTIDNIQADTTTADITITYGSQPDQTFTNVSTKALDALNRPNPRFIGILIGTVDKPVSSLVTVKLSTPFTVADHTPVPPAIADNSTIFNVADFAPIFQQDSSLDKLSIFNILVIPGVTDTTILSEAAVFCEQKQAFLIMDPPINKIASQSGSNWIGDYMTSPTAPKSINAALYFPYIVSTDPTTGNPINLPPSGTVAGIYARTDNNRGVWKAPAGLETTLVNTTGVVPDGVMNDVRQGTLNPLGVNCLRSFPGVGTVVFGARTSVTAIPAFGQWRYVPVRRMTLFIEQTLYRNLGWVVFEPNDDPLWVAIRTSIENFMLSLFQQGAFQGDKPSKAFQVKCDSTTTTQTDIDNGIVNIIVAFAPLKPAEFVIVKIAQLAGQAQA